jgi:hypothetical protein
VLLRENAIQPPDTTQDCHGIHDFTRQLNACIRTDIPKVSSCPPDDKEPSDAYDAVPYDVVHGDLLLQLKPSKEHVKHVTGTINASAAGTDSFIQKQG